MNAQNISDEVVATIRKIIRAIDLQSKKLTKKYGLTGPQILILKEIARNDRQSLAEISHMASLSQATVTSILDRLESRGFAIRKRNDKDRRQVNISLTPKAREVLRENPSLLQEDFSAQFSRLEEWEQNMLLSSLQRLASMMDAHKINSPPVLVSGPIDASTSKVEDYLSEEEF